MRLCKIAGTTVAALLTVTTSAFAQTPAQSSDPTATQTFAGCLMKESDYRRAHNLGAGQIGGVGLGDEFVLVDVKVTPAKETAVVAPSSDASAANAGASATATASVTAASPCADRGVAYRLTGSDEEKLKDLVGRQLEIVGRFKDAGATAAATPPADKLPAEVEIVSFREAPGAAPVSAPVTTTPPVTSPPVTTPPPTDPPPATTATTTRPSTTVERPRAPVADPAAAPTTERRELPRTAGSSALLALIGVLALSTGVALTAMRRRVQ